jgi:hypothetical protein
MILQQTILFFINTYWAVLVKFFSDYLLEHALAHASSHLLVKLNKKLDFAPLEKLAAEYHHQSGPGAPVTHATSKLIRAMLVKYLYDFSLRETEERLYSDTIIRWFVGYGLFDSPPDHTTLERFELWLKDHQRCAIFDETLDQIRQDYPDEHQVQIGDSYALCANAARENLTPMILHLCKKLLRSAAETLPEQLAYALRGFDWLRLFGVKPEPREYKLNKAQRAERLQTVVLAALDLHQRLSTLVKDRPNSDFPALRTQLGCLSKIIADEVLVENGVVQRLPPKQQGSFRIGSATDLEATYRVHGPDPEDTSFGYNVQVAISKSSFVSEIRAYTGAVPDQAGVAALVGDQKERQGICPEKLIYDQAAGCGKTRAEVEKISDGQTQLSAKLPPYETHTKLFAPYDFVLSQDGKTLTCPNHKSTQAAFSAGSGDGRNFRFYEYLCWEGPLPKGKQAPDLTQAKRCPLWEKCRQADQGPRTVRQVFISDYREQVLAAQAYNQSEEFTRDMKLRPGIERIIFELTHYNGARQARRVGLDNADWQAKMNATAYNLKHWLRMSDRRNLAVPAR